MHERVDKTLPEDKIIITSSGLIKENNYGTSSPPATEQQQIAENKINFVRGSLGISGMILLQTNPNILKCIGVAMTGSAILYDAIEPIVIGVSKKIKAMKTPSSS